MILIRRIPGLFHTYKYTTYSIIILTFTVIYFLFKWNLLCTNFEARNHANGMCKFYSKGKATGSLCEPMCLKNDISSLTCHTFGSTKEAVFSAEWHNTRLVFKSVPSNTRSLHWFDNGILRYPTENEFQSTIRSVVKISLNITLSHEDTVRLSHLSSSYKENDINKRHKEMENIWKLVQNNEYLLTKIYVDKDIFPQILGTCGPYFAVEYMKPLQVSSSLLSVSDNRDEWAKRLKTSVQILDLLEELETSFPEPLHLCDIKLDHFGLVPNTNQLKFIDLDAVHPRSVINKMISSTHTCTKDDDCDFFDCRSRCLKNKKKCDVVNNNNLQIVCEKIFLGWRLSNTVIVPGLLISQHTPAELASVLRQCANPRNEEGKPRATPDYEVKNRLYNILTEVEQSVSNNAFL